MTAERDEVGPGTPEPSAGSAEPGPEQAPPARDLDPELLEQGGELPRMDALDPGESGAPMTTLGAGGGDGPGPGGRHEGGAGGSGAVVGELRDRGRDVAEDEEEPAAGGPPAGPPSRP